MAHYAINLLGHGSADAGDVMTQDGEVIGMWSADDNDIYCFTPTGAAEVLFSNAFLSSFCIDIQSWHERQEQDDQLGTRGSLG